MLYKSFAFLLPQCACECAISEDAFATAGDKAHEQKSTQGKEQKRCKRLMPKSIQKNVSIPYLDNIEITLMKIFNEMSNLWGLNALFLVNGFLSVVGSTLIYDRILNVVKEREIGGLSFWGNHSKRTGE